MRRGITTWLSRQLIAAALQCSLSFLVLAANALDGHVHPHRAAALPCNCLRRAFLDSGVEAQGSFPCRIFCVVCSDSPCVSVARFNRAGFVSQRTQKKAGRRRLPANSALPALPGREAGPRKSGREALPVGSYCGPVIEVPPRISSVHSRLAGISDRTACCVCETLELVAPCSPASNQMGPAARISTRVFTT